MTLSSLALASYQSIMELLGSLPTVVGVAAVGPALLLLWLVIATDERPGPPFLVWAAFLSGAASIFLLRFARVPFAEMAEMGHTPFLELLMQAMFGIAAPEEAVKILVIVGISNWRARTADPMDTVVYGAAAGLGFAAYENLAYLMQHHEMWRTVAVLRNVLTVPFHGALGVIAGAYIAIARTGNALGANRRYKDLARIKTVSLIVLAPVALHACFDLPLLTLREFPEIVGVSRRLLEAAGLVVGFGTIALAARLVRRIGAHHAPHTDTSRERQRHLRGMWALIMAGGFASFAGTAFFATSLDRWLINTNRSISFVLVPLGLASIGLGVGLLVLTALAYLFGRNRLWKAAPGPIAPSRFDAAGRSDQL